jgi:hypothetical protein
MPFRRLSVAALVAVVMVGCGPSPVVPSPSPVAVAPPTSAPSATPIPTAPPTSTPAPSPTPEPTPSLLAADLTGLPVDPAVAHRLPLAVMIDDARAARPQSGFNAASIVYQAPADGYETRYLFLYQETEGDDIGPVRSARFFLIQWAQETRSVMGHYGGDQRSRTYLKYHPKQFTDVDALGRGSKAFHRIKTRSAPHNGYTSTADLRTVAARLGAPETLDPDVFRRPFRDALPIDARAPGQHIRVPYSTNVITYRYDPATNLYRRSIDGRAHIDPADDRRVTTTNVVVLFQRFRIDTKIEPGHARPDLTTVGSGKAIVYQEGHRIEATWRKVDDTGPTRLFDADSGAELPLVRGRTFFQVVPTGTKVSDRAEGG